MRGVPLPNTAQLGKDQSVSPERQFETRMLTYNKPIPQYPDLPKASARAPLIVRRRNVPAIPTPYLPNYAPAVP